MMAVNLWKASQPQSMPVISHANRKWRNVKNSENPGTQAS